MRHPPHRPMATALRLASMTLVVAAASVTGCNPTVKVEPIKVEPIHVTLDINIRIDKELDKFFDFEEKSPASKPQSRGHDARHPLPTNKEA